METDSKKLLHRTLQGKRLVEIFDRGDFRYLYFNTKFLQSKMSLSAPHQLVLPYTRYMMLSLLFLPTPARILLIGVGAGSLVRFLHHLFPACIIDAVDHSQEVIDLARGYFLLPVADTVNIHCQDGVQFLENRNGTAPYDLILLDAFDELGMADVIYNSGFFSTCRDNLTTDGLLCSNLWSGKASEFDRVTGELKSIFTGQLTCPVPNRGNIISYAFQKPVNWRFFKKSKKQEETFPTLLTGLDYEEMKARLARSNLKQVERAALLITDMMGI